MTAGAPTARRRSRDGDRGPARPHDDRGVVAVLTVLVVTGVVLPLLALVVDLGLARAVQQQASGAADSAALAAAMVLRDDETAVEEAAQAARGYVEANFSVPADSPAWDTCADPSPLPTDAAAGTGSCVSVDLEARRVRVTVPGRTVPSVFAGVLGLQPPAVSSTATAAWAGPGPPALPCPLCGPEPVRLVR